MRAQEKFPFFGEVNTEDINVRSDSTTTSLGVFSLKKGQQVEVFSEFFEWYKIYIPEYVSVYVSSGYAECIKYKEDPESAVKSCLSARITADRINIRSSPDKSGVILGSANKNEIVDVKGEKDGWYIIAPVRNTFGWVHKKFITKLPLSQAKAENFKTALTPEAVSDEVVVSGVVNSYGMVLGRKATHKLVTSKGEIFLLKGSKSTLNALKGKQVKIKAKKMDIKGTRYPVLSVLVIEVDS